MRKVGIVFPLFLIIFIATISISRLYQQGARQDKLIESDDLHLKWIARGFIVGALGWGWIESVGDFDHDGSSEILRVAPLNFFNDTSIIQVFDGATGEILSEHTYDYPLYYGDMNIGDVDGDGQDELVWATVNHIIVVNSRNLSEYTAISIEPYGGPDLRGNFLLYDVNNDGALDALLKVVKTGGGFYNNMAFDIKNSKVLWATMYQEKYHVYYWQRDNHTFRSLITVSCNSLLDDINGDGVLDFVTVSDNLVLCATNVETGEIIFNISLLDYFPFYENTTYTPMDPVNISADFPICAYMVSGDFDKDSVSEIIFTFPRRLEGLAGAPPSYYRGVVFCIDNGSISWNVSVIDYYDGPWEAGIVDFGCDFDYDFAMYLDGQLNRLLVFDPVDGSVEFNESFWSYDREFSAIDFNGDNCVDFFAAPFVFDGKNGEIIADLSDIMDKYRPGDILFFDADMDGDLEMLVDNLTHLACFDIPNAGWRIFWDRFGRIIGFPGSGCVASLRFVDGDGDFLSYYSETVAGSDPGAWDSDGDGLSDGFEVLHGLNPVSWDSDFDFIGDSLDPMPLNPLVPTYGLIIVLVAGYLLYRRQLRSSKKK